MSNKTQWYLIILATAWLFVDLALVVVVYLRTESLISLAISALITPILPIYYRIYRVHFPLNSTELELEKLKIQQMRKSTRQNKKTQPPSL